MRERGQVPGSRVVGAAGRAWRRLQEDAAAALGRYVPASQWPALAIALEIGAAASLLLGFAPSDLAWYGGTIVVGLLASGSLAQVALGSAEPEHTLGLFGRLAAMALCVLAPLVRLALSWPRHRLLWFPVPLFFVFGLLSISPFPPRGPVWWTGLVLTGVAGWTLARRRVGLVAAFLPVACLALPHVRHIWGPLTYSADVLARSCPGNDGVRPRNVTPSMLVGAYHAVTPVTPSLWLLTGLEPDAPPVGIDHRPDEGRGGSWWLVDRGPEGLDVLGPSMVQGNLWRGCSIGDAVWFVRVRQLIRVRRADGGSAGEAVERVIIPMRDMDVSEVACDASRGMVYFGEATQGGLWRWSSREGTWTRWELGGLGLFPRVRGDGRLVIATTDALLVFDPERGEVVESHPAGYFLHGLDVCPRDGSVIVADLGGRVRLFEAGPTGSYRLVKSVEVPAARRVAFSPNCAFAAVTSFDDRTLWALRVPSLDEVRRFRVGPVVRDVTFVGARRVVVADACTATVLEW